MILLAILFPGISFLLRGKLFSALVAIVLQVVAVFTSLFFGVGFGLWLVLAFWAVSSRINANNARRIRRMEKKIIAANYRR